MGRNARLSSGLDDYLANLLLGSRCLLRAMNIRPRQYYSGLMFYVIHRRVSNRYDDLLCLDTVTSNLLPYLYIY